jgi:hypothetical protein
MATTTTNYGFDVPTSSDLVKNGATQIALLGQDLDTFLFRPFTRNAVINGSFDIWQRGTSFTAATVEYTADRWMKNATAGYTFSRQTSALTGIQYCARYQRNSGGTNTTKQEVFESLETADSLRFAGQTVTLSFYARAGANYSATSNLFTGRLFYGTGTDQNVLTGFTGVTSLITSDVTLTTSWQRFTASVAVPSAATQLAVGFQYTPTGTASTNDYFEVTGVQLEVGNQVSPFIRAAGGLVQQELAACQRYYYRVGGTASYEYFAFGVSYNTTNGVYLLPYKSTLRTNPSAVEYASLELNDPGTGTSAVTSVTIDNSGSNQMSLNVAVASGLTAKRPYFVRAAGTTAGYIAFSAEL